MLIQDFFKQLEEFFKGVTNDKEEFQYHTKYYCQAETFSFEIFKFPYPSTVLDFLDRDNNLIFESEVYHFWNDEEEMEKIIADITQQLESYEN